MKFNCQKLKSDFSAIAECSSHPGWCITTAYCLPGGVSSSSGTSDCSKSRCQHSNGGWLFICSIMQIHS